MFKYFHFCHWYRYRSHKFFIERFKLSEMKLTKHVRTFALEYIFYPKLFFRTEILVLSLRVFDFLLF